jgi:signal transduction histidine kinase
MVGPDASVEERLRASCARVVAAADAERRATERALHDGVQQDLIALAVKIQLARQLADSEPAATDALLEELGRDAQDALGAVRALSDRIYPSVLASRGLPDALHGAASAAGVSMRLEAKGLPRYPPEVEATVYFCCRAALESTASRGARASVRIWEEAGMLRFEVAGDARSDPAERDLLHLRDRVEALDGELTILRKPGEGRRVSAAIPVCANRPPPDRG